MGNRAITKALGGIEDLLLGTGIVNQIRGGNSVPVTKIDAAGLIYEDTETLRKRLGKKVEVLTNVAELQALLTSVASETFIYLLGYTTAGDGGGGLFWLDTTDTTTVEDLNIVFNPDDAANGRWKRVDTSKYLSIDRGDADYTIEAFDFGIQQYSTALTANRTVNLPTTGLYKGKTISVLRTALGSFNLLIGTIVTLTGKGLVELLYNGTTWVPLTVPLTTSGGSEDSFNGSFEIDSDNNNIPDNWAINEEINGTIEIDSLDSAHGVNSLKFTSGGNGGGAVTSERFDVLSGGGLTTNFVYKASSATVLVTMAVRTYDRAGALLSTFTGYSEGVNNPTEYTKLSTVVVVDAIAVTAEITFTGIDTAGTTIAAGATVNLDNVYYTVSSSRGGALVYPTTAIPIALTIVAPITPDFTENIEYDTAGIVTGGRLVVPLGISKVKVTAQVLLSANAPGAGTSTVRIAKNGAHLINVPPGLPESIAIGSYVVGHRLSANLTSAVLEVVPGDSFTIIVFSPAAFTIPALSRSFLAMEIIE